MQVRGPGMRGRPPALSEEQRQYVYEQVTAGRSMLSLARQFGVSGPTIGKVYHTMRRVKAGELEPVKREPVFRPVTSVVTHPPKPIKIHKPAKRTTNAALKFKPVDRTIER